MNPWVNLIRGLSYNVIFTTLLLICRSSHYSPGRGDQSYCSSHPQGQGINTQTPTIKSFCFIYYICKNPMTFPLVRCVLCQYGLMYNNHSLSTCPSVSTAREMMEPDDDQQWFVCSHITVLLNVILFSLIFPDATQMTTRPLYIYLQMRATVTFRTHKIA